MFKMPRFIYWIATFIVMFAICSPFSGYLLGVLLISQNVNSLLALLLAVIIGISLYYYLPIVQDYFKSIFNLLQK